MYKIKAETKIIINLPPPRLKIASSTKYKDSKLKNLIKKKLSSKYESQRGKGSFPKNHSTSF